MEAQIQLSNPATVRAYFEKVRELQQSGERFPIDLDEVWPLIYSRKDKAVRSLRTNFYEGEDYEVLLPQNGEQRHGGHNEKQYRLTVACMEYFIARKVRDVFDVYRTVFHRAVEQLASPSPTPEQLLLRQAQALLEQQQQINELRQQVQQIQRPALSAPMVAVPPPLPTINVRTLISRRINEYCGIYNVTQSEAYTYLYKRMADVYRISVYKLVRRASDSYLDTIERYGHLDKLYGLMMAELAIPDEV